MKKSNLPIKLDWGTGTVPSGVSEAVARAAEQTKKPREMLYEKAKVLPQQKTIEIWVTRYALTKGILHYKNATHLGGETYMVHVGASCLGMGMYFHREGRDWHRTEHAASEKAGKMLHAKIKALRRQIVKLQRIRIPILEGDKP